MRHVQINHPLFITNKKIETKSIFIVCFAHLYGTLGARDSLEYRSTLLFNTRKWNQKNSESSVQIAPENSVLVTKAGLEATGPYPNIFLYYKL
jgi:hypothetical protein